MKQSISVLAVAVLAISAQLVPASAKAAAPECKVLEKTMLRPVHADEEIEAGAIAVAYNGVKLGLKDLLADGMIHFMDSKGQVSNGYVWMYSHINKVANRDDKYLVTSYGEDVIITVEPDTALTKVTYFGTTSGKFLTLNCK